MQHSVLLGFVISLLMLAVLQFTVDFSDLVDYSRSSLKDATDAIYSAMQNRTIDVAPTNNASTVLTTAVADEAVVVDFYNASQTPPGRLFLCGWKQEELGRALFPEYQPVLQYDVGLNTTPNDVLVFGMHGPCGPQHKRLRIDHKYVHRNFHGKALFFDGEAYGDVLEGVAVNHRNPHVYQTGWVPQKRLTSDDRDSYIPLLPASFVYMHFFTHIDLLQPRSLPADVRDGVVYVASNCVPFREKAARTISQILPVYYGGKCHGTTGNRGTEEKTDFRPIPEGPLDGSWSKNINLYGHYRYCLVMENKYSPYYVTEKSLMAFLGGCVPIYFGDVDRIRTVFSTEAFIYWDVKDPQPAINQLRYLQQNASAYREMRTRPMLANGTKTLEEHFSLADDIGNGVLKQMIRKRMGINPGPTTRALDSGSST